MQETDGTVAMPGDFLPIAHGMGKRVIAELVEDAETVRLLGRFDADFAQGYPLGRPAPLAEALAGGDAPGKAASAAS